MIGNLELTKHGWAITPDPLLCDGRAVSRTEHPRLFAVLGEVYGRGDGETTFNLPDLRVGPQS